MLKRTEDKLIGITIGVVILTLLIVATLFGTIVIKDILAQNKLNKEITQSELDFRFYYIQNQIEKIQEETKAEDKLIYNEINKSREESINKIVEQEKLLSQKIYDLPKVCELKKIALEQKLLQVTVVVNNVTAESLGSGVTIKYKNKFYILTAGHMLDNKDDKLTLSENGSYIGELEVVKWDYTWDDDTIDVTKVKDLLLLKVKNPNITPKFYVELADTEPITSSEVYIVGNPAGMEDVLCEGRVIRYAENFVYYINHTYYGNSGGGLYTKDGKLVGIVSHMLPISYNPIVPAYMIYGATRLNVIIEFLQGIK